MRRDAMTSLEGIFSQGGVKRRIKVKKRASETFQPPGHALGKADWTNRPERGYYRHMGRDRGKLQKGLVPGGTLARGKRTTRVTGRNSLGTAVDSIGG